MTTLQTQLGSGFNAASTAADVLGSTDLTGKVAVVTGGYSGIGVPTVRALRAAGARVIVPTRDIAKANDTLRDVDGVVLEPLDLMDPASIDAFTARFDGPLHLLINSAGIMAAPLRRDAAGHESHFSTNHLGHFRLTTGLWPALQAAEGARVVSVSSFGHRRSDIVWEDIDYERRDYDPLDAYGQSKTANVLFAVEADRRGAPDGIHAFAVHPGSIITELARHTPPEALHEMAVVDDDGNPVIDPARNMKTLEQGAATSLWAATSDQLDGHGGVYCENSDIAPFADQAEGTGAFGVTRYAVDTGSARRLWALSEELTDA
jgi:NAD(P)-dependent dehydrogenase (short-subunit alcohol dehydrogenase family)